MGLIAQFATQFGMTDWSLIPAISRAAGAVLFAAIWQSALVAAGLAICMRLVPRANATHRFLVWGSGFGVALCLPFLQLFWRLAAQSGLAKGFDPDAMRPLVHVDLRWSIAITAVWAICSLYRAVDLAVHSVRLRKLWKSAKLADVQTGYAAMLEIPWRKRVEICTTGDLERPSVIGFLAPRILIPEWLFARLTAGELDQIVLHETEHLRRGDDWTNLLQKISLIVFPLNPVLLWMERRLCLEREMACDEGVVRVTRAPRAYAACLTSLAERGMQRRHDVLSLGVWRRRPELVGRVHSILARRASLSPVGARSMMVVLGCGLLFGSAELSRCPQLIAFTSATTARTGDQSLRSANSARMVNVGYFPEQNPERFATGVGRSYPAPHMTQLKAVMPVRQSTPWIVSRRTRKSEMPERVPSRRLVSPVNGLISPRLTAYDEPQPVSGREAVAEAAETGPDAGHEQGWIVLTTWEVVMTPTSDVVSDQASYDQVSTNEASEDQALGQDSRAGVVRSDGFVAPDGQPDSSNPGFKQAPGRVRVTQLVFRVLPSQNGSPAEAPVRASWLVIQL